jgi:hypothetical protein
VEPGKRRRYPIKARFLLQLLAGWSWRLDSGSTLGMRRLTSGCFLLLLISLCHMSSAQTNPQTKTLVVNGRSGDAGFVQLNGRTYVDVETLARIADGSLAFRDNQVTLELPASHSTTPPTESPADHPAAQTGLSRDFRTAAIETLAEVREWASTTANAIQNGYPITQNWAVDYREKAATSLRKTNATASTESDHSALALLTTEFQNVETWSNDLIEARSKMDAAKYTMSSDALRSEPLSQKIITCGHFLGTMLGSGDFKDDPSCH